MQSLPNLVLRATTNIQIKNNKVKNNHQKIKPNQNHQKENLILHQSQRLNQQKSQKKKALMETIIMVKKTD